VYFLPAPICSVADMKKMHFSIASQRMRGYRSHHLTLGWSDGMLKGTPKSAQHGQGALKVVQFMFLSKWSCAWPSRVKWCESQWPILLRTLVR
jgi:hypothetical protein